MSEKIELQKCLFKCYTTLYRKIESVASEKSSHWNVYLNVAQHYTETYIALRVKRSSNRNVYPNVTQHYTEI
jgi:hypothetical protein